MSTRTQKNQFNVEWNYAQAVWTAAKNGLPIPPVPLYQIWEVNESTGKKKLVKELPINPMKVTYNGVTYFG